MTNISQLKVEPHHFLKDYFGDKYLALSINEGVVQYIIGDLDPAELSYLRTVLELIIQERITRGGE